MPTDSNDAAIDGLHDLAEQAWDLWPSDQKRTLELIEAIETDSHVDDVLRAKVRVIRAALDTLVKRTPQDRTLLEEVGTVFDDEHPAWTVRMLVTQAFHAGLARELDTAIELCTRALAIAQSFDDDDQLAFVATQLAKHSATGHDFDAAGRFLDVARSAAERCGSASRLGGIHQTAAHVSRARGNIEEAIDNDIRAAAIYEELGDDFVLARVLNNISAGYSRCDRLVEAIDAGLRALELMQARGFDRDAASMMASLGGHYAKLGDYPTAMDYHFKSRDKWIELNSPVEAAHATANIGRGLSAIGDHERALEHHREALAVDVKFGGARDIGWARLYLAEELIALNDYSSAIDELTIALELFSSIDERRGRAGALLNLGVAYSELGRYKDSSAVIAEAAGLFAARGDGDGVAFSNQCRGMNLVRTGDVTGGIELFLAARSYFDDHGMLQHTSEANRDLARAYETAGMHAEALACFHAYDESRNAAQRDQALKQLHMRELHAARRDAEMERTRAAETAEAMRLVEIAHRELKEAQTQLVHSEKMASLGQLTAGIAHEINNPVNFIRNSTSPLRRDLDEARATINRVIESEPEDVRARIESRIGESDYDELRDEIYALLRGIEEGATRTAEIVQGLRTFSRLDEDEMKAVDLIEGIRSTLRLLGSRINERISVREELASLPLVLCRPGQINQVVMNLLSNAIDAVGESGEITISTAIDGNDVTIAVKDNGKGIEPQHRDRLFEPFFTTKSVGSGTGLGLSISHSIVDAHGGRIDVDSVVNVGTTFTIVLPTSERLDQ